MIPIRDDAPRVTTPVVTYFLLGLNVLVYLFEWSLNDRARTVLMYQFGVVPAFVERAIHGAGVPIEAAIVPLFTSMFMHASWWHIIANMWALWIFGDNIEDYLGHAKYLLLYVVSGVAAAVLHILFNQGSQIPTVGASGAIAGVLAAYLLLYPTSRIGTVIPIGIFFLPARLPAWLFIIGWFGLQLIDGVMSLNSTSAGGVAYWAHVGGFATGLVLVRLFTQPARVSQIRAYHARALN